MSANFIRIKYPRIVSGHRRESSISIDSDLFQVFALIRGTAPLARLALRDWALELNEMREKGKLDPDELKAGLSRLVQRRMFGEIRSLLAVPEASKPRSSAGSSSHHGH